MLIYTKGFIEHACRYYRLTESELYSSLSGLSHEEDKDDFIYMVYERIDPIEFNAKPDADGCIYVGGGLKADAIKEYCNMLRKSFGDKIRFSDYGYSDYDVYVDAVDAAGTPWVIKDEFTIDMIEKVLMLDTYEPLLLED